MQAEGKPEPAGTTESGTPPSASTPATPSPSLLHPSSSPAETIALGRALATDAQPGEVWALVGDLGAGKTHFVQGIAQEFGITAPATSPTFALLHEYAGGRLPVYHFDFYRLRSPEEALALGLDEYLFGPGLTLIEWADRFPALLPSGTRWFHFEILEGDTRRITECIG